MESNIKGLVAAGHEMASELKAECGAVDMRSVAKLISDLATQLEVQLVRANALAAENAALKAGAMYFSYGSEFSFECHKTAEEAIAAAEAAIDDYRGDACDGWSEEVESICWGVIIQQATKVGERKKRKCDRVSPWIERVCDYELRPNVETPATDAFLAEVRAHGVDAAIEAAKNLVAQEYEYKDFKAAQSDCCMHPGSDLVGKVEMTEWLVDFAAQLRKGGNQ
ncbi:hypothetical protein FSG58_008005 [Escherichia coli]|uniref:hypothetical protein n=1 Tax=Escherichia coli TaxID=562 RepID=UPI000BDEBC75|nr:hypothetical protein [Escherichia coli]EIF5988529.1 hypothetical protein [Escherichia coli]EIF5994915.1 hypothetical protein [Escherichia coli]MBB6854678.1 hypothetical protein [Escherichia coli]MBB9112338.1 hypothetical protein [Escherichia coli]MBC0543067.1 hypothetical protein [Escherichia coli]